MNLIFDADDTLWENNIYFERAFDEFVEYLDHSTLTPVEVRAVLDELELVNARIHGYGSLQFGRNLQQVYQHLSERHIAESDLQTVMSFAERILEQPIELMRRRRRNARLPGVAARAYDLSRKDTSKSRN